MSFSVGCFQPVTSLQDSLQDNVAIFFYFPERVNMEELFVLRV